MLRSILCVSSTIAHYLAICGPKRWPHILGLLYLGSYPTYLINCKVSARQVCRIYPPLPAQWIQQWNDNGREMLTPTPGCRFSVCSLFGQPASPDSVQIGSSSPQPHRLDSLSERAGRFPASHPSWRIRRAVPQTSPVSQFPNQLLLQKQDKEASDADNHDQR